MMRRGWVGLLFMGVLFAGCAGSDDPSTSPTVHTSGAMPATPTGTSPATGSVKLVPFLSGLDSPIYLTHAGDGSGRIFIVEQTGKIKIWKNGAVLPTPFLDVTSLVVSGGEQGLLGLGFHPDHETNGVFVIDYTRGGNPTVSGDTVVARYRAAPGNPDVTDVASAQGILTVDQPFANHNGGMVDYGPDGFVYIGLGDGGLADDPQNNAQNPQALLGKMLRIAIEDTGTYTVPSDNPFVNVPTHRPEIWATGLRNPWRHSFDRATGDLYMGDVGQNAWEEISFQPAASNGGENYGWDVYEGTHNYQPGIVIQHTLPVAEYDHEEGDCSVTGGYVYRGTEVPALQGYYVLGDYCTGRLWTLAKIGASWALSEFMDTEYAISSFGEDEAGELYLVDHTGSIYKFAPT
ncbi:MAG TPA: PQQ-dependent sugar dehydrogenase [Candidatus Thermoplasmatota archaeon]